MRCGQSFAIEHTALTDVYAYKLSKDAESQLSGERSPLKPLGEALVRSGYNVTIGGVLQGASGMNYWFNLVGVRDGNAERETVVVDVIASDHLVDENPILILFAKRYDVNATKSAIITIPGIVENGGRLASLYGIRVIEATSAIEAVDKLRLSLSP